jgi:hypothetical protein
MSQGGGKATRIFCGPFPLFADLLPAAPAAHAAPACSQSCTTVDPLQRDPDWTTPAIFFPSQGQLVGHRRTPMLPVSTSNCHNGQWAPFADAFPRFNVLLALSSLPPPALARELCCFGARYSVNLPHRVMQAKGADHHNFVWVPDFAEQRAHGTLSCPLV